MLRDTIIAKATDSTSSMQFTQDTDGVLKFYDISRSKWLSTSRQVIEYGIDHVNISSNRWMITSGGVKSNNSGYRLPRNATITSVTAQTTNSSTCTFLIKRNDVATTLYPFSLNAQQGKAQDNLDIELNEDDYLQVQISSITGNVDYPIILIEIAWR